MSLEPLGEEEFAEIDDLLLSEGLPESTMDVCAAEGFLTAIAIGPAPTVHSRVLATVSRSDRYKPAAFQSNPSEGDSRTQRALSVRQWNEIQVLLWATSNVALSGQWVSKQTAELGRFA